MKQSIKLNETEALVMQMVNDDKEILPRTIATELRLSERESASIIDSLRKRGYVRAHMVQRTFWLELTTKGKRVMAYIWPESQLLYA